jgi:N-acetyltransferase
MITTPPASAALSCRKRAQKSWLGDFREMATGWSAIAPPEETSNSGGFVIPASSVIPLRFCWEAILTVMTGVPELGGLWPAGPFEGRIVRLEPIEERHRDGLRAAALRDPHIHRYTNMATFGFDTWFDNALAATSEIPFVVQIGGAPAGSTRFLNIEPFHRRTEIGWTWLERAGWGTGANVETKYLLMRHAFEQAGMMRVEFKTDARNLRVRGALLGVGGTFEGIHRKHMVLPDSVRDSAYYAVVDDDWPRVKAMLEAKIARHVAG